MSPMHPHPRDGSLFWVFLITHQYSLSGRFAGRQEALPETRSKGLTPTSAPVGWKFQSEGSCSSFYGSVGSARTPPKDSGVKVEPCYFCCTRVAPPFWG